VPLGPEPLSRLLGRAARPGASAAVRVAVGLLDLAAGGTRLSGLARDRVMVDGDAVAGIEPGADGAEYAAPELSLGEAGDERADVYAVGVLLWEMLAGRPAFEGKSRKELVSAHLLRTPPPLREVAPDVSEELASVVTCAMARRPEERWQSAAAMREALLAAAPEPGAEAAAAADTLPAPPPEPAREPTRRIDASRSTPPEPARPRPPPRWSFVTVGAILLVLGAWAMLRPVTAGKQKLAEVVAVEAALARGDLDAARAQAEELARSYPEDGRAYALLGHVLFAQREKERALAAYREALRLDPDLGGAPELLANLRATFPDSRHGEAAFRLAETIGAPAEPLLGDLASSTGEARLKRRAAEAIGKIREGEKQ
jgi:hypothetical protein